MDLVVVVIVGIIVGSLLGLGLYRYSKVIKKKMAEITASDIIEKAKEDADNLNLEQKEKLQEIEMELWTKVEVEHLKIEEKIDTLTESVEEKKARNDQAIQKLSESQSQAQSQLQKSVNQLNSYEKRIDEIKNKRDQIKKSISNELIKKINSTYEDELLKLSDEIFKESQIMIQKTLQNYEDNIKLDSEDIAKKIIALVIDRFARPYCDERGILLESFNSEEDRNLFKQNPDNIKAVLEVSGCEILVRDESLQIGVIGYDPVRRELTRQVLEKVLRNRGNFNPASIKRIGDTVKKDLFKNIKIDGDLIAKELGQSDLHPEIKQIMGSLRYRYSFTQNQYFHCAEVGWLAGLLAAEIGSEIRKAKRSGLLHDLGKAMDHAQDGGHAMIGADFIKDRNESPEIVHAVRAHHFDEQPQTDLAFLVIAADAISGARPGARRSTIETYAQKVTELEAVAKNFEGVQDAYILSGGKEVRVIADAKKVDDVKALQLSKSIAQKIEAEINYPGQIKVVVVRETLVSETANLNRIY